ncbi:hypothetical protein CEXT_253381 [Caerostris extrusa]|uniref:Uncharacterized protein n=1 Tax=Caerostris extrusa TaxID=172846 RepID=A0AAV4VL84_CAEEX|nr:hypothetical protein CEXT_253381 [Caerostris extrusa]
MWQRTTERYSLVHLGPLHYILVCGHLGVDGSLTVLYHLSLCRNRWSLPSSMQSIFSMLGHVLVYACTVIPDKADRASQWVQSHCRSILLGFLLTQTSNSARYL